MRIDLHPSGIIDDLAINAASLDVVRVGDARYAFQISGSAEIVVTMWTTRKDRIVVQPWDHRPIWAHLELGSSSELVSLRADACDVHLEQLDRNIYFLALSRTAFTGA